MEYNELYNRIEAHEQWLKNCKNGKRLIIENEDLSNMRITGRNLSKCIIKDCNLIGVDFSDTILVESTIDGCNMNYCKMIGTNIRRAKLINTSMAYTDVGIGQSVNRKNIMDIIYADDDDMCKFESAGLSDEDLDDIL